MFLKMHFPLLLALISIFGQTSPLPRPLQPCILVHVVLRRRFPIRAISHQDSLTATGGRLGATTVCGVDQSQLSLYNFSWGYLQIEGLISFLKLRVSCSFVFPFSRGEFSSDELIITKRGQHVLEVKILTGENAGRIVLIPRIPRADMDGTRQEKVRKYEEFVDRRLKPDLVHAISERDKIFEQQKVFSDLRRNIENMEKNNVTNLTSLVNLGSEVYMQADVPDTRHIFVDVGLGFHVEFTWSEALNFIAVREEKLSSQIEEYTRMIASIKAQIKMVCEGIRELLQLPVTEL